MRKTLRAYGRAYVICLVTFSVLALLAQCVPRAWLRPHIEASSLTLSAEGDYPPVVATTAAQPDTLDSFSTALSLNIVAHGGNNPLVDAVTASYYHAAEAGDVAATDLADGLDLPANVTYARYWHGYLAVIVPLLLAFDLTQIRAALLLAMGLLAGTALVLVGRRAPLGAALSLAIALTLSNVWVAAASTSLAFRFLVALAAVIFVAVRADTTVALGGELDWGVAFFVIGAITVYVDFLDTPLVSLGLPLATYLIVRQKAALAAPPRDTLRLTAACSLSWMLGYALLWASKWVIAILVLGPAAYADIAGAVAYRTGGAVPALAGDSLPRWHAIAVNVARLLAGWLRPLVVALAIAWMAACVAFRRHGSGGLALSLVGIALLAPAWYLALANHSTIHTFFTYRTLCVSVYACCLVALVTVDWQRLRVALGQVGNPLRTRMQGGPSHRDG